MFSDRKRIFHEMIIFDFEKFFGDFLHIFCWTAFWISYSYIAFHHATEIIIRRNQSNFNYSSLMEAYSYSIFMNNLRDP